MNMVRFIHAFILMLLIPATCLAQDGEPSQLDFNLPPVSDHWFGSFDIGSYNKQPLDDASQFRLFENDKLKIYWPYITEPDAPNFGKLDCTGQITTLIKRHPFDRYPTEAFWSDFSPFFSQLMILNCATFTDGLPSDLREKYTDYSTVSWRSQEPNNPSIPVTVEFYYDGLSYSNVAKDDPRWAELTTINYEPNVLPDQNALTPGIASAYFHLYLLPLKEGQIFISIDTYSLYGDGMQPFTAKNALWHYHTIRRGFDEPGFPNFEFSNLYAYKLKSLNYRKNEDGAESDMFWSRKFSDMRAAHPSDYCDDTREHWDRPLICDATDGTR